MSEFNQINRLWVVVVLVAVLLAAVVANWPSSRGQQASGPDDPVKPVVKSPAEPNPEAVPVLQVPTVAAGDDVTGLDDDIDALGESTIASAEPEALDSRFEAAIEHVRSQRTEQAIDTLLALIEDYPDMPELYVNLGAVYAAQGQLESARKIFKQGLEREPLTRLLFDGLQQVHAALAANAYQKALDVTQPDLPPGDLTLPLIAELSTPALEQQIPAAATLEELEHLRVELNEARQQLAVWSGDGLPESQVVEVQQSPVSDQQQHQAIERVKSWAQAWSSKDATAYVAHYAENYTPVRSISREDWLQRSQLRLSGSAQIDISVSDFSIKDLGAQFSVTFTQRYRSEKTDNILRKRLVFDKEGEDWSNAKIINERRLDG